MILSQETKSRLKQLLKVVVKNISKKKVKVEKPCLHEQKLQRPFGGRKLQKNTIKPWVPNSPDKNEKLRSIYFQMINNSDVTVTSEQRKEMDQMIKAESLQRLRLHEALTADLTGQPLPGPEGQQIAAEEKRARSIERLKAKLQEAVTLKRQQSANQVVLQSRNASMQRAVRLLPF